jgi:hypothetical protein
MGIFIDKILKPIFLSKESNWIRRLDKKDTNFPSILKKSE